MRRIEYPLTESLALADFYGLFLKFGIAVFQFVDHLSDGDAQ